MLHAHDHDHFHRLYLFSYLYVAYVPSDPQFPLKAFPFTFLALFLSPNPPFTSSDAHSPPLALSLILTPDSPNEFHAIRQLVSLALLAVALASQFLSIPESPSWWQVIRLVELLVLS